MAGIAAGVAALVTAATELRQLELGHTELRQLEPALLLRVAGAAAVATGFRSTGVRVSRSTAGGLAGSVAGRLAGSTAGGLDRSTAVWVDRCTAGWINRSTAGWIDWSTAGGLNAAATAAAVGLEQAKDSGLGTVGY